VARVQENASCPWRQALIEGAERPGLPYHIATCPECGRLAALLGRLERRLGIQTVEEAGEYALNLLLQLVGEVEAGRHILLDDGSKAHELVFRPARAERPPLRPIEVPPAEQPTRRLGNAAWVNEH
jgi:hypothetical protein